MIWIALDPESAGPRVHEYGYGDPTNEPPNRRHRPARLTGGLSAAETGHSLIASVELRLYRLTTPRHRSMTGSGAYLRAPPLEHFPDGFCTH